ncbi:MAG: hypothetical protein OEV37_02885 [Candidatus Berkelbacteria bacterium]|nr:hypothetical protein [Candidatus Berkelbacteria bacterium]
MNEEKPLPDRKLNIISGRKDIILLALATFIIAAGNIATVYFARLEDSQIGWVGFYLVWFNLLVGWLTYRRKPVITYMFFGVAVLLILIILINKYWILGRTL